MTKICIEDGYKTQFFFGPENGKQIFCKKHKKDGMVDNSSKKCLDKDCKKSPTFNFLGQKPIYCSTHKLENMTRTSHKSCNYENCGKSPSYNTKGKLPLYCSEHKLKNMIDVKHKNCEEELCRRNKIYGFKDEEPKYCRSHKKDGMLDLMHKLCEVDNCTTRPTFGTLDKNPTHCFDHKLTIMKNVVDKHCTSCGLFRVVKKNDYLCYYCQPTPRMMKKETKVKTLLEENGLKSVHNKQINNDCCLKYHPDFLFDCTTYFVVLECDEDQHSSYDKDCELIRMNNISTGLGLPTLFVRYNPDLPGFKVKQKHKKLLETLDKYLNMEVLEDPTPIYLFYKEK
jgi:hypothetical protein